MRGTGSSGGSGCGRSVRPFGGRPGVPAHGPSPGAGVRHAATSNPALASRTLGSRSSGPPGWRSRASSTSRSVACPVGGPGEHIALLVTGLLFWMPIVCADPAPSRLSHPARILYLFVAMPAMAFLGLTIVTTRHVLYPAYAQAEGVARALADQRAAGAIMWAGTMVLIVPALAFVLLDWMRADEREASRVDARLARSTMRRA